MREVSGFGRPRLGDLEKGISTKDAAEKWFEKYRTYVILKNVIAFEPLSHGEIDLS